MYAIDQMVRYGIVAYEIILIRIRRDMKSKPYKTKVPVKPGSYDELLPYIQCNKNGEPVFRGKNDRRDETFFVERPDMRLKLFRSPGMQCALLHETYTAFLKAELTASTSACKPIGVEFPVENSNSAGRIAGYIMNHAHSTGGLDIPDPTEMSVDDLLKYQEDVIGRLHVQSSELTSRLIQEKHNSGIRTSYSENKTTDSQAIQMAEPIRRTFATAGHQMSFAPNSKHPVQINVIQTTFDDAIFKAMGVPQFQGGGAGSLLESYKMDPMFRQFSCKFPMECDKMRTLLQRASFLCFKSIMDHMNLPPQDCPCFTLEEVDTESLYYTEDKGDGAASGANPSNHNDSRNDSTLSVTVRETAQGGSSYTIDGISNTPAKAASKTTSSKQRSKKSQGVQQELVEALLQKIKTKQKHKAAESKKRSAEASHERTKHTRVAASAS